MNIVQKVTNPDNWIRTSPSTIETNRHLVAGERDGSGAIVYHAHRKEHRLHDAKYLGGYAAPGEARDACRSDYAGLPSDGPSVGPDFNTVMTGQSLETRLSERQQKRRKK